MLAALCFVAGAPIAPPGANVSAAEPPPPAAANVSALVTASAAGDAVNSAALLQEVLAEVRQLRGRVEELAQAPAPDARAPLKPRTPAARRPPLPTLPTLSSSSRRQSSLAAAAGQSLLAFRPAVLMPAAASGPGSSLLAGLESLVHGVVGNATSSLLARPGYSPATLLAAKKTLTACATGVKLSDSCTCGAETCLKDGTCTSATKCEYDRCSVVDGSGKSSAYPCTCGINQCTENQKCTSSSSSCDALDPEKPSSLVDATGSVGLFILGAILISPLFSITLEAVCRQPLEPAPIAYTRAASLTRRLAARRSSMRSRRQSFRTGSKELETKTRRNPCWPSWI